MDCYYCGHKMTRVGMPHYHVKITMSNEKCWASFHDMYYCPYCGRCVGAMSRWPDMIEKLAREAGSIMVDDD